LKLDYSTGYAKGTAYAGEIIQPTSSIKLEGNTLGFRKL
jgi:hypothetical protein